MKHSDSFYADFMLGHAQRLRGLPEEAPSSLWRRVRVSTVDSLLACEDDAFFIPELNQAQSQGALRILNTSNLIDHWKVRRRFRRTLPRPTVALLSIKDALVPRAQAFRPLLGRTAMVQEVHDRHDRIVSESLQYHRGVVLRRAEAKKIRDGSASIAGTWIYMGLLHRHFGHFLVDSLPRLWPALLPTLKGRVGFLVDEGVHVSQDQTLFGQDSRDHFALTLLERLGLGRERFLALEAHSRVEKLLVPVPVWRREHTHYYSTPMANDLWNSLRSERQNRPNRVYFTRRHFTASGGGRPLSNEGAVEKLFESRGFTVIAPEEMALTEQLDLLADSEVIAGTLGSNMFNAVFMHQGKSFVLAPGSHLTVAPVNLGRSAGIDTSLYVEPSQKHVTFNSKEPWQVDLAKLEAALDQANLQ
ncbi:MAG: glycosyltransferase family 61 protein [Pseudomonadota bacterium]